MQRVILASGSPRRRELLAMLGIPFEVVVSDAEECITSIDPMVVTRELSRQKAEAVAAGLMDSDGAKELPAVGPAGWDGMKELADSPDGAGGGVAGPGRCEETEYIIIGADTVVSVDGVILGKPRDREDAGRMILSLQGRSHMVYTGVTILRGRAGRMDAVSFVEGTKVNVAAMGEEEIRTYLDTDEPYDKAGAYGIQGAFARFIEGIEGDYFNVVGLPVHRLYSYLALNCQGVTEVIRMENGQSFID